MSLTTNGVGSTVFGDPLIPGSPDTLAALSEASAPEPSTSALLACLSQFAGFVTGKSF
jgi:hypothetical protein